VNSSHVCRRIIFFRRHGTPIRHRIIRARSILSLIPPFHSAAHPNQHQNRARNQSTSQPRRPNQRQPAGKVLACHNAIDRHNEACAVWALVDARATTPPGKLASQPFGICMVIWHCPPLAHVPRAFVHLLHLAPAFRLLPRP
jgi:hypothetical protein